MRIGIKDVKKESKATIIMGVLLGVFMVILMIMAVMFEKKDAKGGKYKKETLQEQSARLKY